MASFAPQNSELGAALRLAEAANEQLANEVCVYVYGWSCVAMQATSPLLTHCGHACARQRDLLAEDLDSAHAESSQLRDQVCASACFPVVLDGRYAGSRATFGI
jgi:hypothetical protein